MSLMSGLYVGTSGLKGGQNALNTTAHNLSNIETPGYTRQQVQLGSRSYMSLRVTPNSVANQEHGLGVSYTNVKQVRDVFYDKSFRRESGRSMFYEVSAESIYEVETLLGEMDNSPFQATIDDLWVAVQEMGKDPTSAVTQGLFVQRASELVERAVAIYDGLAAYQDNLNQIVKDQVNQINLYGKQIVALNDQIRAIEAGGVERASDLKDERNRILDELSKLVNVNIGTDYFGNATVQIEGVDFVKGDMCYEMAIEEDTVTGFYTPFWPQNASYTITAEGTRDYYIEGAKVFKIDGVISSELNTDIGGLKATYLARGDHRADYRDLATTESYDSIKNSVVMNVMAQFDQLAHSLSTKINGIFQEAAGVQNGDITIRNEDGSTQTLVGVNYCISKPDGYLRDHEGKPIQIFDRKDAENYTKAQLDTGETVWIRVEEDPQAVETIYSLKNLSINTWIRQQPSELGLRLADGSEDMATANKLMDAFTEESYRLNPTLNKLNTFTGYYSDLVAQAANAGYMYQTIHENQVNTVESIQSAREQIMGVSSDEELANMIRYQNAYNASSRYINVISQMLEHLVSSLGA
ncbi:MAG: flagellar hook-associated protein FlgK [Clostridium sp.]|jgi:flagellar hook-associated protein 1 FlgK|nr:flagellar hook-associated protein FlgK [Clostridium sp.]